VKSFGSLDNCLRNTFSLSCTKRATLSANSICHSPSWLCLPFNILRSHGFVGDVFSRKRQIDGSVEVCRNKTQPTTCVKTPDHTTRNTCAFSCLCPSAYLIYKH